MAILVFEAVFATGVQEATLQIGFALLKISCDKQFNWIARRIFNCAPDQKGSDS